MEKRTTYCGNVSAEFIEKEVVLKGWVQKRRDLGGVIFIDLRDREGIVQVVLTQKSQKKHGKLLINVVVNTSSKLKVKSFIVIKKRLIPK